MIKITYIITYNKLQEMTYLTRSVARKLKQEQDAQPQAQMTAQMTTQPQAQTQAQPQAQTQAQPQAQTQAQQQPTDKIKFYKLLTQYDELTAPIIMSPIITLSFEYDEFQLQLNSNLIPLPSEARQLFTQRCNKLFDLLEQIKVAKKNKVICPYLAAYLTCHIIILIYKIADIILSLKFNDVLLNAVVNKIYELKTEFSNEKNKQDTIFDESMVDDCYKIFDQFLMRYRKL